VSPLSSHCLTIRRPIGRGGAGSVGQSFSPVDLSTLSIEERDAHIKVHGQEGHAPVRSGGRGGAGNIRQSVSPSGGGDEERGRGSGGVFGSMLRSLSRAARGGEPAK